MKQKEKINYYPFVELPDPKVRYLIRDADMDPLVILRFDDQGVPSLRYLKTVSPEIEVEIVAFMNDKQRLLFG